KEKASAWHMAASGAGGTGWPARARADGQHFSRTINVYIIGVEWGLIGTRPGFVGTCVTGGSATPGVPEDGGGFNLSLTASEILSALARSKLTCHIWVSFSECLNSGIPVNRIPFATFQ